MVLGAVLTVTAASSMYQWADTESIPFGRGKLAPIAAQRFVKWFTSSAFIGFPCPRNSAGIRSAMVVAILLRGLLRFSRHHANLFQHTHKVVKEVFLHNLTVFVPMCDRAKVNMEAPIRRLNHASIRHRHRPLHSPGVIGNRASPFTLRQHNFVWIVDQVLVRKRLKECNRLLLMRIDAWVGG
jgi:hypothetical protein